MNEFRARDVDRDRAVEVIETAYVDGQLGDADRELRVSRALLAETLGELEGLTRDLQSRAAAPDVVPPGVPAQVSTRSPGGRLRTLGLALGGLVAVGVLGAVPMVLLSAGNTDYASSGTVEAPVVSSEPAAEEAVAPFRMTPAGVRRFVAAYEKKFGTLEAFEVGFFPRRVDVQVPVGGSRPRMERWTWDGEWRQDTLAAAVIEPDRRVDAGAIDVRRLVSNIGVAERSLEVEGARFTHAVLHRRDDAPAELDIHVRNESGEGGYLSSTPAGQIARRHPYDA